MTEWTGGLYISPTVAGSRSGALVATAWASLVALGEEGLLRSADGVMQAATEFQVGSDHAGVGAHKVGWLVQRVGS